MRNPRITRASYKVAACRADLGGWVRGALFRSIHFLSLSAPLRSSRPALVPVLRRQITPVVAPTSLSHVLPSAPRGRVGPRGSASRRTPMKAPSLLVALALAAPAPAANIYIFASGDTQTDSAVVQALTAYGHTCTLGVQYMHFDGTISLAPYQAVYLQASANWYAGELPAAGATQLRNWVQNGGRLVTSEWATYYSTPGEAFAGIATLLPLQPATAYSSADSTTFTRATPDAVIGAGLPLTFLMPLTDYTGTEIYTVAKSGATTYYTTAGGTQYAGLAGWSRGSGSVFSFSTTGGPRQFTNGFFPGLLSNAMG